MVEQVGLMLSMNNYPWYSLTKDVWRFSKSLANTIIDIASSSKFDVIFIYSSACVEVQTYL